MRKSAAGTPARVGISICFPIRCRKVPARTRSAIQNLFTAIGTSIYCQRPTGGNIIIGVRTASSYRENLHLENCTRSTLAPRKPRGAPFETPSSWARQEEGAGVKISFGSNLDPEVGA
jgi:hypothetical protein